jgi:hypothetical protein
VKTQTGRRPTVDPACAAAVDLARSALDGLADAATVGEHVGVSAEMDRMATHLFESLLPGYRGWRWAVTLGRAPRSTKITVDEAVLLPGEDSLLPPEWVPWNERLRKGDLGVGDLLPTDETDDRLEPGWNADPMADSPGVDEDADDVQLDLAELAGSLDLTRRRVLSPIGLADALDRWLSGDHGPESAMAQSAPDTCATCGFRLPLPGRFGQAFGVCANEIASSDGHVVAMGYGCGAHSEAVVVPAMSDVAAPIVDELGYEDVASEVVAPDGGTVRDDDPGEELGHG